jgi:hypothetical protein
MEIKQFKHVSCAKYHSNLYLSIYNKDLKVDLAIAKEMVANRIEFTENKKHYVVIDLSNIKEVTPEAKEYMQHPEGGLKNILAAAFYANNPPAELMANIYVKTPSPFPARFFPKKEEALAWINDQMEKDRLANLN